MRLRPSPKLYYCNASPPPRGIYKLDAGKKGDKLQQLTLQKKEKENIGTAYRTLQPHCRSY